jgi:hypothetical protein
MRTAAFAGAILMFTAVCMMVSAALHISANVASRLSEPAPVYDFRFYSLIFLGVFLLANAVICVRRAKLVARHDPDARSQARAALTRVLVASVPLLPFVPHASYFSVFAIADLAALRIAGARARPFAIRRLTPADCDTLSIHERSFRGTHGAALPHGVWANAARVDER